MLAGQSLFGGSLLVLSVGMIAFAAIGVELSSGSTPIRGGGSKEPLVHSLWSAMVELRSPNESEVPAETWRSWTRGWQPTVEFNEKTEIDLAPFFRRSSSKYTISLHPLHTVNRIVASSSQTKSTGDATCPWCFTSFGCWGGKALARQRSVGRHLAKTIEDTNTALLSCVGRRDTEMDGNGGVRFHIAAGDNFYERGVASVRDAQFYDKFESSYPQPALMSLPWLVAQGNHDYRQNFFAQTSYTQAVPSPGGSGGASFSPSGRWFMPFPYYSARVDRELLVVTLDCPLLERCHNNKPSSPRCWDGGAQRAWFEHLMQTVEAAELESPYESLRFRVLQCHYPLYANGPHVNHQWLIDWLEPLLVKHCFQLYINADNHYLQVAEKSGVAYINSGGGAGYGRHAPSNKGYAPTPYSKFLAFTDGYFTHCVYPAESILITTAIDAGDPNKEAVAVFNFTSKAVTTSQCRAAQSGRQGSFGVVSSPPSQGPPKTTREHSPTHGVALVDDHSPSCQGGVMECSAPMFVVLAMLLLAGVYWVWKRGFFVGRGGAARRRPQGSAATARFSA